MVRGNKSPKEDTMNNGTRIRTILAVLTTMNTVLAVTDVAQFNNEKLTLYYKIASVVINALVVGINTYFNNDYTEAACEGTGYMRYLKAMQKGQAEVWTELGNDDEEVIEDEDESIDEDVNIESSTESVEVIDDEENYEVTEDEEEVDEEIEEDEEIKEGEK